MIDYYVRRAPYYDETDDSYVLQGYKITDPAVLAQMSVAGHETVIRFPRRMMQFFPEVKGGRGGTDV